MSAYECWKSQKEPLRQKLAEQSSMADVVYCVRHAVLQTEQNTLSELEDDELRQQTGVLFSCVKTSVGLLEAKVTSKVWEPQAQAAPKAGKSAWTLGIAGAILQAVLALYCYMKHLWLGLGLAAGALVVAILAFVAKAKKPAQISEDQLRVTLHPDVDKLLSLLDAQFRAMDRYVNDLSYLNDQLRGGGKGADARTLARFSDLLEALYEIDSEERAPAEEAVKQLMESMKLRALDYSNESRKLFTALPSKSVTRTISPAIVSTDDCRLLKRGTAAVQTEVA